LILENSSARHSTKFVWRLVLWICGLSAGAVLVFTELTTGVTAPTLGAMVGLLTITAFGDHLIQKNKARTVPISPLTKGFTSFVFRSPRFRKMSRVSFECFTKDERVSWLKNEPNFTKRIATPLNLTDFKHRPSSDPTRD